MQDKPIKVRTRLVSPKGIRYVVVDRFQKRQSAGRWVNGNALEYCQNKLMRELDEHTLRLWPVASYTEWPGGAALCLCLENELDPDYMEPEQNEYGEVSP